MLLWNKLHTLLRQTNIKSRLIIALLLITIVPIVLSGLYSYKGASDAIRSKISTYSAEIMKQIRKNVQLENKKYIGLSDSIMLNSSVQQYMQQYNQLDEVSKKEMSVYINRLLTEKLDLLQKIKSVKIIDTTGQVIYDMGYNSIHDRDIARVIQSMQRGDGSDQWSYLTTEQGEACIVLTRPISSLQHWDTDLGYIMISISEPLYSSELYADVDMGTGADIFIADQQGVVISSRYQANIVQQPFYDQKLMPAVIAHEANNEPSFLTHLAGAQHLIAYSYDMFSSWYLVSTIPDSYLNNETKSIQYTIFLLSLLLIVISVFLALLISKTIYKPIIKLVEQAGRITRGNLQVPIVDEGKDEISYLTDRFNNMVVRIQQLLEETEREQQQKREIEIQMLQAQINPHFLFNALNSLKWTAQLSQADSVSTGLGALAALLRNTIVDKQEHVSLTEEIRNIDHYVIIQKMRYGATFDVNVELDPQVEQCLVPKFILQPLVENAIIHGQEGIQHHLIITITCSLQHNMLQITISDNGAGIPEQRLEQLLQGERSEKSSGRLANIGLMNVQDRIVLSFGKQYGLRIVSKVNEGTIVYVALPLVESEKVN
ncbi:sensor histidine kinase [Paenibacillus yanchengensis]|uniref:histidine kinase n=1 Tax=Paenibacillus yanchengensis TaxID=2035833 RepID=A0ABW4YFX6_9BACL